MGDFISLCYTCPQCTVVQVLQFKQRLFLDPAKLLRLLKQYSDTKNYNVSEEVLFGTLHNATLLLLRCGPNFAPTTIFGTQYTAQRKNYELLKSQ